MPADWSGAISPVAMPLSQSQLAQERWRGRGLRRSRNLWCMVGASCSSPASSRNESESWENSAHFVYTMAWYPPPAGRREIFVVHVPTVWRRDRAALVAAGQRCAVGAAHEMRGGLGRLLEQRGPYGL